MSDAIADRSVSIFNRYESAFSGWMDRTSFSGKMVIRDNDRFVDANIAFVSEAALEEVWLTPEEDEAWKDL
jgi:hypothetical protein